MQRDAYYQSAAEASGIRFERSLGASAAFTRVSFCALDADPPCFPSTPLSHPASDVADDVRLVQGADRELGPGDRREVDRP